MQEDMARKQQDFIKKVFEKSEIDKRETQRQNIITSFNMLGSQLSSAFSNPKFMMKAFYMSAMLFGAFHATKLSLALVGARIMAKMGKP